jgi:hypothetical protein
MRVALNCWRETAKKAINLVRPSADASPPYGFMLLPGTISPYAFDLIELNGDDLPATIRWSAQGHASASTLAKAGPGIRFNEHLEGDGAIVFRHACKLGLEGIVSKRKDSPYRSGRSPDWLRMKNPNAPAVRGEAEKDQLELVPSWFSPRNLPPLLLRFGSIVRWLQARRYALGRFSVFEARKPCAVASFSHM